jgi:hypothetical protein
MELWASFKKLNLSASGLFMALFGLVPHAFAQSIQGGTDYSATTVVSLDAKAFLSQKPVHNPASALFPSATLLDMAFRREDHDGLMASWGPTDCRTSVSAVQIQLHDSATRQPGCIARVETEKRVSFAFGSTRFEDSRNYASRWNRMNSSELGKGAISRLASRAATKFFATNPVLKALVEGKVALNFSVSQFTSSSTPVLSPKPEYVLKLTPRTKENQALPRLAMNSNDLNHLGVRQTASYQMESYAPPLKEIVELWPVSEPQIEVHSPTFKDLAAGERTRLFLGLEKVPFSDFRMLVEREGEGLASKIRLKIEEHANLISTDLSPLLSGKGSYRDLPLNLKVPYRFHSLNATYEKIQLQPVYFYAFEQNAENKAKLSYNSNTKTYAAEFVMALR